MTLEVAVESVLDSMISYKHINDFEPPFNNWTDSEQFFDMVFLIIGFQINDPNDDIKYLLSCKLDKLELGSTCRRQFY